MANWAKLQEDLIGLPVAKRAKHGIHFDKGNGEIVANFSGKPCHYEDGGIWKPIDTKLLLRGDGYYGCPHSPVKIKPDGTVAVDGTGYVQRAELPSAKTGLVDNDKLVRTFSFGEQRLWITEDGFRSEITLNRIPTLTEAKKLIASESGTLSAQYLKSLTTATDANGNSHTVTTLAAFRTWLASAKFPVVIDPDISVNTGVGGDTWLASASNLNYGNGSYLAARNPTNRVLIRFDLSSIGAENTCTAGTLNLWFTSTETEDTYSLYQVSDANGDWIEGTGANTGTEEVGSPCWNYKAYHAETPTSWAGSAGLSTAGTDYINTALASLTITSDGAGTKAEIPFNASGLTVLGSWFGDATNNGLLMMCTVNTARTFDSGESASTSERPVLTVTYTASGIAIPVAQYYYNRLRRN